MPQCVCHKDGKNMIPVIFKEANSIFDSRDPNMLSLPVEIVPGSSGQLNTCWELSKEEIETIKETGLVWLSILSFGRPIPPVLLSSERPENYDEI